MMKKHSVCNLCVSIFRYTLMLQKYLHPTLYVLEYADLVNEVLLLPLRWKCGTRYKYDAVILSDFSIDNVQLTQVFICTYVWMFDSLANSQLL